MWLKRPTQSPRPQVSSRIRVVSKEGKELKPEVGSKSLFFLRALTLATIVIVLFFIVDAAIG